MNIKQLRQFEAILAHGGISRAAAAMNISQSTLTQSMLKLEQELSARLFERTQSGVKITEAGELLRRRAELIIREFQRVSLEFKELNGETPRLKVGLDTRAAYTPLGQALLEFTLARQTLILHIEEGWPSDLVPKLKNAELDLLISALPGGPDGHPEFVAERLIDTTMRAVVSRHHPCLQRPELSAVDLSNYLWGVRAPSDSDDSLIREAFLQAGVTPPSRLIYTTSFMLITSFVKRGLMIGFLSTDFVADELASGEVVPLPFEGLSISEPFYLAHHARSPLKGLAVQLQERVRKASVTATM